jgi:hypothetical protein
MCGAAIGQAVPARRAAKAAAIGYRKDSHNPTKVNTVIRHIVMWKLKETAEGASRAENAVKLKERLEGCRNIVPGILHLEVGIGGEGLDSSYDVVLVSDFADKAALDAYQVHPTHEALKVFVGAVREARQSVDYFV